MLAKLVSILPSKLQPYAKSVLPLAATAVAVGAHWIISGEFNDVELKAAAEGAALSLLAFLFPNIGS